MGIHRSGQNRIGPTPVVSKGVVALLLTLAFVVTVVGQVSAADDALEARQLVEKAQLTMESFMADTQIQAIRDPITQAKGVYISPQVLRGAFIVGASGGGGVLVARG